MNNRRVLVINSVSDIRLLLAEIFRRRFNIEPLTVSTNTQAEELLKNQEFDLIIADCFVPGEEHFEIIKIMIRQNIFLPTLFFTSPPMAKHLPSQYDFPYIIIDNRNHNELLEIAGEFVGSSVQ